MPKPITPLVGCDVFVLNEAQEVLLIKRSDSSLWALPGGFHDLGETPAACAVRECKEETGYDVSVINLLGVFSSNNYEYVNYKWPDNEIVHLLFAAEIIGGAEQTSSESLAIGWFKETELPALFDGHEIRIKIGYQSLRKNSHPYFE